MSGQWYYNKDGAQYGPVDESEIVRLIRDGELVSGTPVLKVGSMDWQPARAHACFQVEIYPKKKQPPILAPASTTSTTATGATSQSPRRTPAQPAATPSPTAATVVVQDKSTLSWVLVVIFGVASLIMALMLIFGGGDKTEPDFAKAQKNTSNGGPLPVLPVVPVNPPTPPAVQITPPATLTPQGSVGTVLWEFETGGQVFSSPAIGSDGTVYVGSDDKKLYAIKTESRGLAKSPWLMFRQNPLHTGRVMEK